MLNKTIKMLYDGDIHFQNEYYSTNQEYLALKDSYNELQMHLSELLDEHAQGLLEELLNLRIMMDSATDSNDFVDGFKIGARLMLEAIYDEADEC